MRLSIPALILVAAVCQQAQTPTAGAPDWTTVKDLPMVDFTGLTAQQKNAAIKSMHVENCVCGCNMKVAQCRVLDPKCGDSKALAAMVVGGIKQGKTADQVHELLINSPMAKARASENKILGDPVKITT